MRLRLQLPGGLSFSLLKYWDGQPVTYICTSRDRKKVFFYIVFVSPGLVSSTARQGLANIEFSTLRTSSMKKLSRRSRREKLRTRRRRKMERAKTTRSTTSMWISTDRGRKQRQHTTYMISQAMLDRKKSM